MSSARRRGRAVACGFAIGFAAACSATPPQESQGATPRDGARDPQAAFEPASSPGAGQLFLARMAGTFDVLKTIHRGSGEAVVTPGRCTQAMVHGDRFLRSEFTFDTPRGTSTGTGLIGFDAATGRFTSCWIDARATRFSLRRSDGPFDGERIELRGTSLDGDPAEAQPSRTVTEIDAAGRILHRQFRLRDGAEALVMELVLTPRG